MAVAVRQVDGRLAGFVSKALFCSLVAIAAFSLQTVQAQTAGRKENPSDKPAETPGPLVVDDPAEPLTEKNPLTEAERDRLEALALFAAGRMHQQRDEPERALRCYQRALRCDPQAVTIARQIIPLAFKLERRNEAVRYALKAVEMEEAEPLLLRQLGVFLSELGDYKGAAVLYEKALAAIDDDKSGPASVLLRMEMGRLYHIIGKYDEAADCFKRILEALETPEKYGLDEKTTEALLVEAGPTYRLFGECFLLADRIDDAEDAFGKAHKADPDVGRMEFDKARICAKRKQYAKALSHLDAAFKAGVKKVGSLPYRLLFEVLAGLGRADEAIPRLQRMYALDEKNENLGYYLAEAYIQAKMYDKAEPLLAKLIKRSPSLGGYESIIEIYLKKDDAESLLAVMGDVVGRTGVLDVLGKHRDAIVKDDKLFRKLVEVAERIRDADSQRPDYGSRLVLALLALERKDFDTAGEYFNLAIESKPDAAAELLLVWGVELMLAERADEAVDVFQRGIDEKVLPEDNPAFWFYLAGAFELDGRTDKALAAAKKAASLRDELARFVGREAWILYHAERNEEALEAYTKLIERFDADRKSEETREILREARLALSTLCVTLGRDAEAEEWLQQVLDEFPDDIGAQNDLGYLWADRGVHLERAEQMIRKAVDAEPENMAYRDSLGWVLFKRGRFEEAVVELEKAAADEEADAVILEHLGDAYRMCNQPKQAKQVWRRAAKMFRDDKKEDDAKRMEDKIKGK